MGTQAAAAVQSLALAALTLAHAISLWEIVALTAFQGVTVNSGVESTARSTYDFATITPGQVVHLRCSPPGTNLITTYPSDLSVH